MSQQQGSRAGDSVLDNPVWASLNGPHGTFAEINGRAARYPPDMCSFVALSPNDQTHPSAKGQAEAWNDLAALAGPGTTMIVVGVDGLPPRGWTVIGRTDGVQLVDTGMRADHDTEAVTLGPGDVPEMLDLVARTKPGPFLAGTAALGDYLGIRLDGALVAMAGERLHPPGWTEISAVCTDASQRGQGLATRLVRAVAAGIGERGETPFLHAAADNTNAIRLYESLGFTLRRRMTFQGIRVPG